MINKIRAQEPIDFIQLLKHTGDFYGKPFNLLDWQREVLWDVYGTVKENGYRQYQYSYLEVPKKNGKTELVAAIGLYHLTCDGPGGEIYCCAADREQASKTYFAAKQMIEQDPELEEILHVVDSKKEIENLETGTYLKVLSAEAFSKHGLNPTVVIFDELHAQPNRDLWDVMTFGAGSARKEPIWWVITTAGDDPNRKSIGWEIHDKACKIRDGKLKNSKWYVKIYGITEDEDNIYDEELWHKVNPSLGVSIDIDTLRSEAIDARESKATERLFRWLRLNQWISIKRIGWLPITLWDDIEETWEMDSLRGRSCYVGIDLSSTTDLTAAVPLFPPQNGIDKWKFLIEAWMPNDNIKERANQDHVPYDVWRDEGYLNATPGDVIDYSNIRDKILEFEKLYKVKYYCGDPWHLEILKQLLPKRIGDKFIEISQTMLGMTMGMNEIERLIRKKLMSHEHNPLGRWSFGNTVIAIDGNENKKPMKNKSIERIDPTVALINAMSGAVKLEQKKNVYNNRGVVSI